MDLDKLIELYPRVYHMAERGAWDSIRTRGLMSATAVLDHLAVGDGDRARYESEHLYNSPFFSGLIVHITGAPRLHSTVVFASSTGSIRQTVWSAARCFSPSLGSGLSYNQTGA